MISSFQILYFLYFSNVEDPRLRNAGQRQKPCSRSWTTKFRFAWQNNAVSKLRIRVDCAPYLAANNAKTGSRMRPTNGPSRGYNLDNVSFENDALVWNGGALWRLDSDNQSMKQRSRSPDH